MAQVHVYDVLSKQMYTVRKQVTDCQDSGVREKKINYEGYNSTFEDNRNDLYLDYGGSYMTVCTCQNSQNCIL